MRCSDGWHKIHEENQSMNGIRNLFEKRLLVPPKMSNSHWVKKKLLENCLRFQTLFWKVQSCLNGQNYTIVVKSSQIVLWFNWHHFHHYSRCKRYELSYLSSQQHFQCKDFQQDFSELNLLWTTCCVQVISVCFQGFRPLLLEEFLGS